MKDNIKSGVLAFLVCLSLVQSYLLAYSKPSIKIKVKSDYIKADFLGQKQESRSLFFPEMLILHLGQGHHKVLFPSSGPYYETIWRKLAASEFKNTKRRSVDAESWEQQQLQKSGIELRFGRSVPYPLVEHFFNIESENFTANDLITRIWICASRREVHAYFFTDHDQVIVKNLDLTVEELQKYITDNNEKDLSEKYHELYLPKKRLYSVEKLSVPFKRYTIEQMQNNLFFDPGSTTTLPSQEADQKFYTDWKRALKIEQNGTWITFTDTVAPPKGDNDFTANLTAAVRFINQHGGWDGKHGFMYAKEIGTGSTIIRFQQFYNNFPIVPPTGLNFGYMQLSLQQELVISYARSLLNLKHTSVNKEPCVLPTGEKLKAAIGNAEKKHGKLVSLFPAFSPGITKQKVKLSPIWAARTHTGNIIPVTQAMKKGNEKGGLK